jgi:hypothetical protein
VQAALNEMFASGAIDVETYNAALEAARDRFSEVGEAAQFWEHAAEGAEGRDPRRHREGRRPGRHVP